MTTTAAVFDPLRPLDALHSLHDEKIGHQEQEQEPKKHGCTPNIEDRTEQQSHYILGLIWYSVVDQKEQGQEDQQKRMLVNTTGSVLIVGFDHLFE